MNKSQSQILSSLKNGKSINDIIQENLAVNEKASSKNFQVSSLFKIVFRLDVMTNNLLLL